MSDQIDRTDELLELAAEDERREQMLRNGRHPDDPGPAEPEPEPSLLSMRCVNGAWLDAQRFAPLEHAVDRIIPEGLGLIVAPPKKGKSFLVADVGLAVAAGGFALGAIPVAKRPVLYLALEDGHRRLQSRFRRILNGGAIPDGIDVVIKASPKEALVLIAEYLESHAGRKPLVIVDTFGKIKPRKRPGEDAYQIDYETGATLKALADSAPGSTLLLVHHTRKAEAEDFVDSVSGTHGLAGSADFVLVLTRKRHANTAILSVTGRDVEEAEYALTADEGVLWRLDGTNLAEARDAAEKLRASNLGDRMMEVYAVVYAAAEPVTPTDVAQALDMDGDTAGKYLRRLAARDYIARAGRGRYYVNTSELSVSDKTAGQDA
jgi:hypothetical protein